MRIVVGVLLPLFVSAQSYGLKTLIEHADRSNGMIEAKSLKIESAKQSVGAAKSGYWPTVDIGGSAMQVSQTNIANPGQTATAYVAAQMNLYDGGRKSALVGEKTFEYDATVFEKQAFKESVTLEIVRHYYTAQTLKATLAALQERSAELKAQIQRVQRFENAGLSTQEEVYKLQAVYDGNDYVIANNKLALAKSEENLRLLTGLPVQSLKQNRFMEPKNIRMEPLDTIKMLEAKANAVGETSRAIKSGNHPQVNVSNLYTKSKFDDTVSLPGFGGEGLLLDNQNKLMVSVDMRVFDAGKISQESEAVRYQKLALLSEIDYANKEQEMNFTLAKKSLQTTRTQLNSTQSELRAANSSYEVLRQKYEAGLADNVAFLDALAQKTLAQARYKETLYTYEINKSIYYYYAGRSPKEFIQ